MKPFDLQVNGYAGIDFNGEELTAEQLHEACVALLEDGVSGILATVITDSIDAMSARLSNLVKLREADPLCAQLIAGFHIEGPFLNETAGYIGAHPTEHAREATPADAQRLLDAAGGLTKLVTLAPERDPGLATTAWLGKQGVTVAAGHCDPSLDQLRAAIDAGLSLFTHLGNGCPSTLPRHDNIIERVLSLSDELFISFIPDGAHIPFFALANYLKIVPPERAIAVTDAISAARLPPGRHRLGRWELDIGEDLVARAPGADHLVGSTVTMPKVISNLRDRVGLDEDLIRRMICENPKRAIALPS